MTTVPDIRGVLLLEQFYSRISKCWRMEFNYRDPASGEISITGVAPTKAIAIFRTERALGRKLLPHEIRTLKPERRA